MDMSLAQNGLPELSLTGLATTETVGGTKATVKRVCEELNDQASSMYQFADNLLATQEELCSNWDATAAGQLNSLFPNVIETFKSIKPCLESIAAWAQETSDSYVALDTETADAISKILGGAM